MCVCVCVCVSGNSATNLLGLWFSPCFSCVWQGSCSLNKASVCNRPYGSFTPNFRETRPILMCLPTTVKSDCAVSMHFLIVNPRARAFAAHDNYSAVVPPVLTFKHLWIFPTVYCDVWNGDCDFLSWGRGWILNTVLWNICCKSRPLINRLALTDLCPFCT